MDYQRVIPRDLFNEAKLLKCLGQLALMLHDKPIDGLVFDHESPELGFIIRRNEGSGALYCSNLVLYWKGNIIDLNSPYNSKENYPIYFSFNESEGRVFDESGIVTSEFKAILK